MFVEHKEVGEAAKLDEASKLLLKAASVIERQGWCQNKMTDAAGRVCLEGALWRADGKDWMDCSSSPTVAWYAALRKIDDALHQPAHKWNDHPYRTQEEVVAKLRAVALGF